MRLKIKDIEGQKKKKEERKNVSLAKRESKGDSVDEKKKRSEG